MDADAKKTALRMIPYGIYVLTSESKNGKVAAATVNWVTQTAFQPPLIVVGVKADSGAHSIIKESKTFALNILGKDQKGQAFTFFKPLDREGNTIGGELQHLAERIFRCAGKPGSATVRHRGLRKAQPAHHAANEAIPFRHGKEGINDATIQETKIAAIQR